MGFLQRAAITRSSTPSPSRSPTNCGGPPSSEQLSPNSFFTYSSVTAGTGDFACAGGGGGSFFSAASGDDRTATNIAIKSARCGGQHRECDMAPLYPRSLIGGYRHGGLQVTKVPLLPE